MSEQEIRVGQRWRRKRDGAEVIVSSVSPKGRRASWYRESSVAVVVWKDSSAVLRCDYELIEADQ